MNGLEVRWAQGKSGHRGPPLRGAYQVGAEDGPPEALRIQAPQGCRVDVFSGRFLGFFVVFFFIFLLQFRGVCVIII